MNTQQMTFGFQPTTAAPVRPAGLARVKRSYPSLAQRGADASNDHAFALNGGRTAELEAWGRQAATANGFGDAAGAQPVAHDAYSLSWAARIGSHAGLAEVLAALFAALHGRARRAIASWRRARDMHATHRALSRLDARTLRDIGIARSEMGSVAAELAGEADRTRYQALRTLRLLSHF